MCDLCALTEAFLRRAFVPQRRRRATAAAGSVPRTLSMARHWPRLKSRRAIGASERWVQTTSESPSVARRVPASPEVMPCV